MSDWYFDRFGQAAFVVADGDRFVSKNGRNLGWLYQDNQVFSLTGQPLGWLDKGVLRDRSGSVVAFSRSGSASLSSIPGTSGAPGSPSIPGRPAKPGFAGSVSDPGKGGWGSKTIREFFGTDV
ncbi:4-fold beta flower protein [Cohnella soli]|uniref:4-fold beta flower protein n=1 Tax=Cohnella soli TaxID=425005 RepID=A0ABW0HPU5_9BACL